MKSPQQVDLFNEPSNELLRIAGSKTQLSSAQLTFNRLTAQLEQMRGELLAWDALGQQLQTRAMAELNPALDQVREAQTQLLEQIDQLLGAPDLKPALKQRSRQILRDFLLYLAELLLDRSPGPNPRLQAIFDRHSDLSWDERQAASQRIKLRMAEEMMARNFGADVVKDHGAADLDEFMRTMDERMAAQHDAAGPAEPPPQAAPRTERKPNKRQAAAAERKAQEQAAASQSVREIYRKLASSLHPDRETDLHERARKTELMQQINVAYQQSDLLALLNLQMQVDQLNSASLGRLPEERLKQYNRVLSEQQQALKTQLQERIDRLLGSLGCDPQRSWQFRQPQDFEREFNAQLRESRQRVSDITYYRLALRDPRQRSAQIQAFAAELRGAQRQDDDISLFHLLNEMQQQDDFESPRSGGGRARRSRR